MTTNNFDYDEWEDRISAYLNQKMSDADRLQFEADMTNIPDLKDAVEFDKALNQRATEHHLFQHLKPQLDHYIKEKFPDNPIRPENIETPKPPIGSSYPLSKKLFLSVLSLIVLIAISVIAFNRYQKLENYNQIAIKWLSNTPLPYDNTNLANFQTGKDSMAIQAYMQGHYAEAEAFFSQNDVKENNAFGPRGLYRAINALMIQPPKTDKAIEILSARYENKNTFRHEAVEWYLALAYLQKKDADAAEKILAGISKESEYAAKANEILKDLK